MDELCKLEAAKYARVWALKDYAAYSPGEMNAPRAFEAAAMQPDETLNDYGAGTGRAAAWFAGRGLDVLAVDFVPEALAEEVPFRAACLWDMGRPSQRGVRKSDLGYCADVMEHMPKEKVGDVLGAIAERSRRGCFFTIATRPDQFGKRIGEVLHLTVEPATWWRAQLAEHFAAVIVVHEDAGNLIVWAEA